MSEYAPCKHCPTRERNCHATCRDYREWKKLYKEKRDYMATERFLDNYAKYMERRRERGK